MRARARVRACGGRAAPGYQAAVLQATAFSWQGRSRLSRPHGRAGAGDRDRPGPASAPHASWPARPGPRGGADRVWGRPPWGCLLPGPIRGGRDRPAGPVGALHGSRLPGSWLRVWGRPPLPLGPCRPVPPASARRRAGAWRRSALWAVTRPVLTRAVTRPVLTRPVCQAGFGSGAVCPCRQARAVSQDSA